MARKTYVPQLARIALRLSLYIQKHEAILKDNLTTDQYNAVTTCLPCLITIAGVYARETP